MHIHTYIYTREYQVLCRRVFKTVQIPQIFQEKLNKLVKKNKKIRIVLTTKHVTITK